MMLEKIDLSAAAENPMAVAEENGIVVPAILWWLGVPLSLVLILWLVGVF